MSAFGIGTWELIVIMMVVLIVFGPGRLPEFTRNIAKAVREFRRASSELTAEVTRALEEAPEPKKPTSSAEEDNTITRKSPNASDQTSN